MDGAGAGADKAARHTHIDEIRFDDGGKVTAGQLKRPGSILLTAELGGVRIGTVRFDC